MSASHESLERHGIFFDELNRIKIVHQTNMTECETLHQSCGEFTSSIDQLQDVISRLCTLSTELGKQVDKQKMLAISSRNALEANARDREAQKQVLLATVNEKQQQLARYQKELNAMQQENEEQRERIQHFIVN